MATRRRSQIMPFLHAELRLLAKHHMFRGNAGHTLQPTALVNEAYLCLVDIELEFQDRAHFLALAARAMRRILVDHARSRKLQKCGAGQKPISLDESVLPSVAMDSNLVDLDEALNKLARPRVNLTRYHGLFAPNSLHRRWVTPAGRGKRSRKVAADQDEKTPAQPHVAMSWAQRLKRVFNIDVETCRVCGGAAKVIACIEDPAVIRKILKHLQEKSPRDSGVRIPNPRAPPQASLFG